MTATSEKQTHDGSPARPDLRPPLTIAPRGRRRPSLVIAGVAMVAVGALAVAWLVSSAGDREEVVVMARDVPYGATITAADLTTTAASLDPTVRAVPAGDADDLVGLVASTELTRGSLVSPDDVVTGGIVGADEALVPLPLVPERVPAGGLTAGDRLLVVDAPPPGADPVAGAPSTHEARVVRVGSPDVNGTVVVDVVTRTDDGPDLATRAATGRFAIVVLPAEVSP